MKCLIIAAGQGRRLSAKGDSKPLIPLLGLSFIERVILTANKAGLTDFYVVTGYNGEEVRECQSSRTDLALTDTENFGRERSIAIKWQKPLPIEFRQVVTCLQECYWD
ncbi:MAG: NTP transferase domain-containing protein [Desulfobacterales bacterium]|nr:NTP transferase domain-containing protein [Desulfobacterales bacterium]